MTRLTSGIPMEKIHLNKRGVWPCTQALYNQQSESGAPYEQDESKRFSENRYRSGDYHDKGDKSAFDS